MVNVMVNLLDAYTWVVFGDFIEFFEKVSPNSFISYYVSSVFSNKHEVIVAEVYRMVSSYVFLLHVTILTEGEVDSGSRSIPGLYASGYCCVVTQ